MVKFPKLDNEEIGFSSNYAMQALFPYGSRYHARIASLRREASPLRREMIILSSQPLLRLLYILKCWFFSKPYLTGLRKSDRTHATKM